MSHYSGPASPFQYLVSPRSTATAGETMMHICQDTTNSYGDDVFATVTLQGMRMEFAPQVTQVSPSSSYPTRFDIPVNFPRAGDYYVKIEFMKMSPDFMGFDVIGALTNVVTAY